MILYRWTNGIVKVQMNANVYQTIFATSNKDKRIARLNRITVMCRRESILINIPQTSP